MKHLAIIGSGISGLSASLILHKKYKITLFEASSKLGGHTNTIVTPNGIPIDTGFIVFNEKNYPNFCKFLSVLGVESIPSNMSFAYFDSGTNTGYSSDFPSGLFSTKKHIISPSFYKFLADITAFNALANQQLDTIDPSISIYDFLRTHKLSDRLINEYVLPMGAAIWSTSQHDTQAFPAKSFLSFWNNHGLLQLFNRPKWRTIKGGAQTYIDAVLKTTGLTYKCNHPIDRIERTEDAVTLFSKSSGPTDFDGVVIATHADQALAMLSSPTPIERQLLRPWAYSKNHTVLHTSSLIVPKNKSAWASWIYTRHQDNQMSASYWMNRLQALPTETQHFVTLNSHNTIPESSIIYQTNYEHPKMTSESLSTQPKLDALNGQLNTYFCGSYFGYGFHEDGIASSINVGQHLKCTL